MDEEAIVAWFARQLSEFYTPVGVQIWLSSPHRQLNGDTALERIRAGRAYDVQAIIDRLRDGSYG